MDYIKDDSNFTLIWNSKANADLLSGSYDQVVVFGKTSTSSARVEDQWNKTANTNNKIEDVVISTNNGDSLADFSRKLNPDDTTHRTLECGRVYDFDTIY